MNRLPNKPQPFSGIENCFVAGGAILSAVTKTAVSDYDIYPKTRQAALEVIYHLMEEEGCFIINISDRAVTLKSNVIKDANDERVVVQVMLFDEFRSAEAIFDFFDFTVTMGAFDCDTKQYHFHPDFFPDVASKTLRFNPNTKYPLNSMMRIAKYRNKGYVLPTSEMIRMSLTLMQSELPQSWDDLEKVIGGTYGQQVKLRTEDLDFSIENAIRLFDDLDVDLLYPDTDVDYSKFGAEDFATVMDTEMKYYSVNLMDTKYLVTDAGKILTGSNLAIELAEILGNANRFDPWPEDRLLVGYKTFKQNADGKLHNTIYSRKRLEYQIGEWTEEVESPHIYVHTHLPHSHDVKETYEVEFCPSDVVRMSHTLRQINVKKVRVKGKFHLTGSVELV